ncbi:MAG: O-antigen polymerase [Croceibacterium sp.]
MSVLAFLGAGTVYLKHPTASALNPATFYLLFHGLVFVVRPVLSLFYEYRAIHDAMQFEPTEWDKTQVLIATNLALFVFISVSLAVAKPLVFKQEQQEINDRRRLLMIFTPFAIVLSAVAIYSLYWLWNQSATGENLSQFDTRTGESRLINANGYFISLGTMLGPVTAIIAFLGRFKLKSMLPFVIFAILRFGTGTRNDVVSAAAAIGLLFLFDKRMKWPNIKVVLLVIACIPVFNAIQLDRGAGIRQFFGFGTDRVYVAQERAPLDSIDFANMEFFEYIVYVVPQRSGTYDYFLNNLQLFTEPIPRSLWPDKPVGPPIRRFDLYIWGQVIGATMSVPGAGWYSMGYAGVVIWTALFALAYGLVYRRFVMSMQGNIAAIAMTVFASISIVAFRDGSLVTIFRTGLFFYVPIVLLAIADRYARKGEAVEAIQSAWITSATAKNSPVFANPKDRREAIRDRIEPSRLAAELERSAKRMSPRERRLALKAKL